MRAHTAAEMVIKLVGPIEPTADHGKDQQRLENLKELEEVINSLLWRIERITDERHRHEASVKAIGEHAFQFLRDLDLAE